MTKSSLNFGQVTAIHKVMHKCIQTGAHMANLGLWWGKTRVPMDCQLSAGVGKNSHAFASHSA